MTEGFQPVLAASERERRDLFLAVANRLGTAEQNIEKDFWVCWTLDALFNGLEPGGQPATVEELEGLSGKRRTARLDAIRGACQEYIRGPLQEQVGALLRKALAAAGLPADRARVELDDDDPDRPKLIALVSRRHRRGERLHPQGCQDRIARACFSRAEHRYPKATA